MRFVTFRPKKRSRFFALPPPNVADKRGKRFHVSITPFSRVFAEVARVLEH